MKGKQLLFAGVILILLLVGWIAAVQASRSTEVLDAQTELWEKANGFSEKELYVRAIPYYRQALGYSTDNNVEIERDLLDAYYNFGETESYLSLVESRASAGTALEDEYLNAAELYVNSNSFPKAAALLKTGIAKLGSESLVDYFEANRYGCTIYMTGCEKVLPTAHNNVMPAFDGSKWGYIDSKAHRLTQSVYDFATPFNSSGYAVVLLDGRYYCINSDAAKYGIDETGVSDVFGITDRFILAEQDGKYGYYNCDFVCVSETNRFEELTINSDGLAAVKQDGKWGFITDGGEAAYGFVFEDVAVNSLGGVFLNGAAMVKYSGQWYLIGKSFEKLSQTGFADAKAPESGGYIAVCNDKGLWGYIDRAGNLVIDYQYSDARSFSNGLGAVKIAGKWGYISERGELVIDAVYEDAQPFRNGVAQVKLPDGIALLHLDYFEE